MNSLCRFAGVKRDTMMVNLSNVLVAMCLLPAVFGCSCSWPLPYSTPLESLCMDYQRSSDVFTARVINASCKCAPSYYGQPDVACVSSDVSEYFTTKIVLGWDVCADFLLFGASSCDLILNKFKPIDCPYEGQEFMDCAPLCPTTCSNEVVASLCPKICVRGCGCPEGMVIDEEQRRCVMPSQCPNKTCLLNGQVITLCANPEDCFTPGTESCVHLCNGCTCALPTVADNITGECVQPNQCTTCPIKGQLYTECGPSCPRTCDNVNDTIECTAECWQGCVCPSGMVIDVERRKCVEPHQCIREPSTVTTRTSKNETCKQQFICPFFNTPQNDYNLCQYTVEVTEVFKGGNEVGKIFTHYGPDLLTSCGDSQHILSVGTTYVVGIGSFCSAYSEWTPYSQYPAEHRQALSNSCSPVDDNSSATCPPTCSHEYCSRQDNKTKPCSRPPPHSMPACPDKCHLTHCDACYYSKSPRNTPKKCNQKVCKEQKVTSDCLRPWAECVDKRNRKKNKCKGSCIKAENFRCYDYPQCNWLSK